MKFGRIGIVFAKEVIDNLRDRRTLINVLLSTMIGPAMLFLLFTVMGRESSERADKPIDLPVSGAEYAPNLITFLSQNDVKIQSGPADPESEVRAGNHDVVLVIPSSHPEDFTAGRPATVRLVVDQSRQSSGATVMRVQRLLEAYNNQIATLRLMARGVSPTVVNALALEEVDVATPQSMAAMLLYIMPFFLVIAVSQGHVPGNRHRGRAGGAPGRC